MRQRLRRTLFGSATGPDSIHLTEILRQETVGGLLMLGATLGALLWANFGGHSYEEFRHLHLGPLSLQHWASDGLLTIFFFVIGLELKREFAEGALSRPADALVPIVAAVTGMVLPALLYVGVNAVHPLGNLRGWAVPMATDIAFALAVLAIVGSQLPSGLRATLLTLAVVDDLGAIAVIALFFSHGVSLVWLVGLLACAVAWYLLQRAHIDYAVLYLALGIIAWWCTLQSGVHATVAGVVLGLLARTSPAEMNDPVDRWGHAWRPVSAALAVPVFALLSAGVALSGEQIAALLRNPVPLGIAIGLLAGKAIGITGGAWLTARFTSAELAEGVRWKDVAATSVLAGMGFTVSLLVAELAFGSDVETLDSARAAVLIATLIAAVIGGVLLRRRNQRHAAAAATR